MFENLHIVLNVTTSLAVVGSYGFILKLLPLLSDPVNQRAVRLARAKRRR